MELTKHSQMDSHFVQNLYRKSHKFYKHKSNSNCSELELSSRRSPGIYCSQKSPIIQNFTLNSSNKRLTHFKPSLTPGLGTRRMIQPNSEQSVDLNFATKSRPDEEALVQWIHAMRQIARLGNGLSSSIRPCIWSSLIDRQLVKQHVDWAHVMKMAFDDVVDDNDNNNDDDELANPDGDTLGAQIVKDLHRTGCEQFVSDEDRASLKRVLLAYARYNKRVGYCQGFNVIAAVILDVTARDEKQAFKVMVYLIDYVLPESYFAQNLQALSVDIAVFHHLLQSRLPHLANHLHQLQYKSALKTDLQLNKPPIAIDNTLADDKSLGAYEPPLMTVYIIQWFLTLFANSLPPDAVLRLWDSILLEGSEIILRTAIVMMEFLSSRLLKLKSADQFYGTMSNLMLDFVEGRIVSTQELLFEIYEFGPFPYPGLKELREQFMQSIAPLCSTYLIVQNNSKLNQTFSNEMSNVKKLNTPIATEACDDDDDLDGDEVQEIDLNPKLSDLHLDRTILEFEQKQKINNWCDPIRKVNIWNKYQTEDSERRLPYFSSLWHNNDMEDCDDDNQTAFGLKSKYWGKLSDESHLSKVITFSSLGNNPAKCAQTNIKRFSSIDLSQHGPRTMCDVSDLENGFGTASTNNTQMITDVKKLQSAYLKKGVCQKSTLLVNPGFSNSGLQNNITNLHVGRSKLIYVLPQSRKIVYENKHYCGISNTDCPIQTPIIDKIPFNYTRTKDDTIEGNEHYSDSSLSIKEKNIIGTVESWQKGAIWSTILKGHNNATVPVLNDSIIFNLPSNTYCSQSKSVLAVEDDGIKNQQDDKLQNVLNQYVNDSDTECSFYTSVSQKQLGELPWRKAAESFISTRAICQQKHSTPVGTDGEQALHLPLTLSRKQFGAKFGIYKDVTSTISSVGSGFINRIQLVESTRLTSGH